jgi:2-amino-4-hydroxy-6-hydroxymethyldihydropteridine diphosphokinase
MSQQHRVYLSLGSNIDPELNLPRAIELLAGHGNVEAISSVWESRAVGSSGPNFLNGSVLFITDLSAAQLKDQVIRPVESALGRVRTADKNAPRTIDIDIMMVDGKPFNLDKWDNAFVLLPISELLPEAQHPLRHETLRDAAESARRQTWIVQRPGLLESPP